MTRAILRALGSAVLLAGCGAGDSPAKAAEAEPAPSGSAAADPAADRDAQCNALVVVINSGVERLQNNSRMSDASGVAELERMAAAMDSVAASAAGVELRLPRLLQFRGAYVAMARAVAKAARDMAAAAQARDVPAINAAQSEMERAVAVEDPLVDEINAFCQGP